MEKLVFFSWGEGVLCGIQTLKIIYMSYLGKVLESLKKKFKIFKDLKFSGVSGFSFRAIEPTRKVGNDGKFRKPNFNG